MVRFEDRDSAVTRGGSGIGRATAMLFAKEGCKVVVADIDDAGGTDTVRAIKADGGQAIFAHTDVTKSGDAEKMVKNCVEQFGRLDILANIAGIFLPGSAATTPEDVWDRVIAINLKGAYLCSKYAVPVMVRQGGGAIVNMSSVCGFVAASDEEGHHANEIYGPRLW